VTPDEALEQAAGAILTGAPVDWGTLERTASPDQLRVIRQLRVLAEFATLHGPADEPGPAGFEGRSEAALLSWGPLEVLEPIGCGAFGRVYRAWDRRLDRQVALKLLDEAASSRRDVSGEVIREGRLLARIRHPNVATIYGADRIDGTTGLWMEFVDGPTLLDIVASQGPLAAEAVQSLGMDLTSALQAVHEAGLLHQDIKAQNVMRHRDGRIVLTDFGAGIDQRSMAGEDHVTAGTPLYVAPEILRGEKPSVRSDVYSLGVLLYYAATGAYPVEARTHVELNQAHREGRRIPLQRHAPTFPAGMARVIERAAAADPGGRFETSADLGAALAAAMPGADVRPSRAAALSHAAARREVRLSTSMSVLLLTLAAATGALLIGARQSSPREVAPAVGPAARQIPLPPRTALGPPAKMAGILPYVSNDGRIALLDPATGGTTAVTRPAKDGRWPQSVVVSPDGREVAYVVCTPTAPCELLVASAGADAERIVASFDPGHDPQLEEWPAHGRSVLARLVGPKGALTIATIGLEDGTLRTVRHFTSEKPLGTSLSPDGRFLAFDLPAADTAARDIHLLDIATGVERVIVDHPAEDAQPLWTPDGRGLFFLSNRSGLLEGWLLQGDLTGGTQMRPDRVLETYGRAAPWVGFGPGGRLYHWRQSGAYDVHLATIGSPGESRPVPSRYSGSNRGAAWSPDGRYLAYVSMRYGGFELEPGTRLITIYDTVTGTERLLDPGLGLVPAPPIRWSPDGLSLVCYCVSPQKEHGSFVIDVATGQSRMVVEGPPQGWRTWAPDGRALVIADRREGLLAYDLTSRARQVLWPRSEIPVVALNNFGFSPDGRHIAFSGWLLPPGSPSSPAPRTSALGIFSIGGGHRLVLTDQTRRVDFQAWTPDGADLIVARAPPGAPSHELWSIPVNGGAPRSLEITNTGNAAMNAADLSPDGRTLALSAGTWLVELWVYENFLPSATREHPRGVTP
jgi:eukaryotic-like serine/threonine-protein kinase